MKGLRNVGIKPLAAIERAEIFKKSLEIHCKGLCTEPKTQVINKTEEAKAKHCTFVKQRLCSIETY
jgi:hypothetical protein